MPFGHLPFEAVLEVCLGPLARNIPRFLSLYHAKQNIVLWIENQEKCSRSNYAW